MARQRIEINKSLIPYTFNIVLAGEEFTFRVDYNNFGGFFTIGLSKGGETLCEGEPIVYGRRLFEDVWRHGFPALDIVAADLSGTYNAVTYSNFGEGVLLYIDNEEKRLAGG